MDQRLFGALDDICLELERGISMITVIADGLNRYVKCNTLTGAQEEAYVRAVVSAENVLTEAKKRLQDTVEAVSTVKEKKEAVA